MPIAGGGRSPRAGGSPHPGDAAPAQVGDAPPVMDAAHAYGEDTRWEPATPRLGLLRTLVSWVVGAAAVWIAAAIVPGVGLEQSGAAFLVAALRRRPERGAAAGPRGAAAAVHARDGLPARARSPTPALLMAAHELLPDDIHVDSFGDALLASLVIAAVSLVLQAILGTNDDDQYSLKVTRRIARRQGASATSERPGDPLPGDRRARAAHPARRDARRQRADDGRLDRRGRLPARRVGDRPLVADRGEPGGHPARLQRGHPRVPLGGEGVRAAARVLRRRRTAPRSSAASRPASGCSSTAARAAATCSPARRRRRS